MKKSYLMIAAAALVFAACANEKPVEIPEQETVIGFSSYSTLPTRTASAVLEDYHTTMAVYGTKTTKEGNVETVQRVFDNVTCTYTASSTDATGDWVYSPARYWDKQADNYQFIGFAPANAPIVYTMTDDSEIDASGNKFESSKTGTTTNTLTLEGVNLQEGGATTALKNSFKGSDDADHDVMIVEDAVEENNIQSNMAAVDLVYKHTLAKLVVALKKGTNFTGKVEVKSVTVSNYKKIGTFDTDTWTSQGDANLDYKYTGTTKEISATASTYFIESLVMPQAFTTDQELTIKYKITSGTGATAHSEDFAYTIPLKYSASGEHIFADGVNDYEEDTVYTITITIAPNVIQFDGGVASWTGSVSGSATID